MKGKLQNVVAFAHTGIAASLIDGALSFHKTFRCPLDIRDDTNITINDDDPYAQYLKSAKLYIWDEGGQASKYASNMVERYLQHLMGNKLPFGGKTFFITGDWRQTLPILKMYKVADILNSTLKQSRMWPTIRKLKLTQNMRVDPDSIEFQKWLLEVGDGRVPKLREKWDLIPIDDRVVIHRHDTNPLTMHIDNLVDEIFGADIPYESVINMAKDPSDTSEPNCIVTPFNVHKNYVNGIVLQRLKGPLDDNGTPTVNVVREYIGFDSIKDDTGRDTVHKTRQDRAIFNDQYLNKQQPGNMPPHRLYLKLGNYL